MNKKVALITGVYGQDGSYLAALLSKHGYTVHGVVRPHSQKSWRHAYLQIEGKVTIHECDLENQPAVTGLIEVVQPTEIYHLAAQSSVPVSLQHPAQTLRFNTLSVLNLLESIRLINTNIKFFHASSSEIFDPAADQPLTAFSPIRPANPYGISKATSHLMVQQYRKIFGLFVVNGILFPHESPLRQPDSFIKKLIQSALSIKNGSGDSVRLGQVSNQRDFGDASNYTQAMLLTLQVETPDDYIISSGNPVSIKDIAEYVLKKYELPFDAMYSDPTLFRHPNAEVVYGDNARTQETLGWKPSTSIFETIDRMIEFEEIYPRPNYES